ncbi:MAG: DUF4421 family protein [Bacteroidia bacterium]|nr:DUF4421 family protein [Bacteroidia bacterium]
MLVKRSILFIAGCLFINTGFSQEDSIRNNYVKGFPDYFFLGPVIKQRNLSFDVASVRDQKKQLTFKPNSSYSVGLSLNIFDIGIEAAMSIPINVKNQELYGTSTVRDLQINTISKRWLLDAYHQKYSGFYLSNPNFDVPSNQPYPHRDDLQTRNLGLSFSYIFNADKFSLRSTYSFSERQRSSHGSFLFSYIVSSFNLAADSALISRDERPTFGKGSSAFDMRFTSLGIGPGYSYNLVYRKFFINLTLSVGPAHYWIRYTEEGGTVRNDIRISTFQSARAGIGYNGDRFYGGISSTSQVRSLKFEEVKFTNKNSAFRLILGYRFKEFGILKKHALDYNPIRRK